MATLASHEATQQMRAFCSVGQGSATFPAKGNPCSVTILAESPENSPGAGQMRCLSWPIDKRRAGVRCWTAGGIEIKLCGHGLLCSASRWIQQWGGGGTLVMNGSEVLCYQEEGLTWLGFQALCARNCDVPHWCENFLGTGTIAASTAGPDDGYLVLQWPQGFDLKSLPTPNKQIATHTRRALIVTCAMAGAGEQRDFDIHYRYFAPQHGVLEDSATGSAMRVLASYWQDRALGPRLSAYQCSAEGGMLFSRIERGKVWIGGCTAQIAKENASLDRKH